MPSHLSNGLLALNVPSAIAIITLLLIHTSAADRSDCKIDQIITVSNEPEVQKLRVINQYPCRCPYGYQLILMKVQKNANSPIPSWKDLKEIAQRELEYLECKPINEGKFGWVVKLSPPFESDEEESQLLKLDDSYDNVILSCKKINTSNHELGKNNDMASYQEQYAELERENLNMKTVAIFVAIIPCVLLILAQCIILHGYGKIKQFFTKKKVAGEGANEELVRDSKKEKTLVDVNEVDKQTQIGGETMAV